MNLYLTKTSYCRGIQCPKMLWMDHHMPEERVSHFSEAVKRNGNLVGNLARGYFGDYDLVEYQDDKKIMIQRTEELMKGGAANIAEAAFAFNGLYCAVDILHRDPAGNGYDLVEVKSSSKVSDIYVDDMAFQYYVLTRCGVHIQHVFNMHINTTYVRHGSLELQQLFTLEDYTQAVKDKYDEVEHCVHNLRSYAGAVSEPELRVGRHCEEPYDCDYFGYCGRDIPEQSVLNLASIRKDTKYKLIDMGIVSYEDVVSRYDQLPAKGRPKINDKQRRQAEMYVYEKPALINPDAIKEFLDELTYPIYHLDFETYMQVVPQFDGVNPYMQIPFQYSLHIEHEDGTLEHREFLAKEETDPRRMIAESLCRDIPDDVCLLAYNMSFEKGVLSRLAAQFPDLEEHLLLLADHLHDLMIPFRNWDYYCYQMDGSYSIKYVLPALCPGDPELDYQALEGIHKGDEASEAFADLPNHTPEEIEVIRHQLLQYCRLDTLAMVKVLGKLREVCR